MYFLVRIIFIFLLIINIIKNSHLSTSEQNNINVTLKNYENFTFTISNKSNHQSSEIINNENIIVDCFGFGKIFAKTIEWFFKEQETPLFTSFFIRSRRKSHRDKVLIGDQFGLEWTDFDIRRKTIVIVHGFLSNGDEDWIKEMEEAFLLWVSDLEI